MRRFVTIAVIAGMAVLQPLVPSTAHADERSDESSFVVRMNDERSRNGLSGFAVAGDLVEYARRHSRTMADQWRLHHSTNLRSLSNWDLLGENVGRGSSVDFIHRAFMDSPAHRDNVLRHQFSEVGVGVVVQNGTIWVTVVFRDPTVPSATAAPVKAPVGITSTSSGRGYWIAYADGSIGREGDAPSLGSPKGRSGEIVAMAGTPTNRGYWLLDSDGGVYPYGDARMYGSIPGLRNKGRDIAHARAASIVSTSTGRGYWILDDNGGIFTFGDARFRGSIPGLRAQGLEIGRADVIGMAPTESGNGYWVLDSVGGVFTFGDASFRGSIPALRARGERIGGAGVIGMAPTGSGDGYWVLDDDGGVFTFGDARFLGSVPGLQREGKAPADVRGVDVAPTPRGDGYWVLGHTGDVFGFGSVA